MEAGTSAADSAEQPGLAVEQPGAAETPAAAEEQISDAGAAPTGLPAAAEDPALAEAAAGVTPPALPKYASCGTCMVSLWVTCLT